MTKHQLETLSEMRESILSQNADDEATAELAGKILTAHAEDLAATPLNKAERPILVFDEVLPDLKPQERFDAVQLAYAMLVQGGWVEQVDGSGWTWTTGNGGPVLQSKKYQLTRQSAAPLFPKPQPITDKDIPGGSSGFVDVPAERDGDDDEEG